MPGEWTASDAAAPPPRPALLESLAAALVSGAPQPARTDCSADDWDLSRDLLGRPGEPISDDVRADVLGLVRHQAGQALPHVLQDDKAALRLFGGALLHVVGDAGGLDLPDDDANRLRAARVLLGVAPQKDYAALRDPAGQETWEPLGLSRNEIHQRLMAGRKSDQRAAGGFARGFDPRLRTSLRALAALLDSGGTYDNYSRSDRRPLRRIAEIVLDRTSVALADPEVQAALGHRLLTEPPTEEADVATASDERAPASRRRARVTATVALAVLAAVTLVVSVVALLPDGTESDDRPVAGATPRPFPTPPPPAFIVPAGAEGGEPPVAPSFSGTVTARNSSTGETSGDGWLAAAPEDEIEVTLELRNEADGRSDDVYLRPRVYTPPDQDTVRVVDFTVRQGEDGPESSVEGAAFAIEPTADETCPNDTVVSDGVSRRRGDTREYLGRSRSYGGSSLGGVDTIGQYALPDLGAGESVELIHVLTVRAPDDQPRVDPAEALRFLDDGEDPDGTPVTAVGVEVGDVVRLAVRLRSSSCARGETAVTVTAAVEAFDADDDTIEVSAMASSPWLEPRRTEFVPVVVHVSEGRPTRLEQVLGTTVIHSLTCAGWERQPAPGDWLLQGGVEVHVPGHVPRAECDTDRYLSSEFRVVAE